MLSPMPPADKRRNGRRHFRECFLQLAFLSNAGNGLFNELNDGRTNSSRWPPTSAGFATSLTGWLVLRNDSTTGDTIKALTLGAPDPMTELRRLWATGKVPHRFEVVRLLKELADKEPEWQQRAELLFRAATLAPDLAVREQAFGALSRLAPADFVTRRAGSCPTRTHTRG